MNHALDNDNNEVTEKHLSSYRDSQRGVERQNKALQVVCDSEPTYERKGSAANSSVEGHTTRDQNRSMLLISERPNG